MAGRANRVKWKCWLEGRGAGERWRGIGEKGSRVSRRVMSENVASVEKRGDERVEAALQYPTLANRSAIHWSVCVILVSFGE